MKMVENFEVISNKFTVVRICISKNIEKIMGH
jgi:hypothetical protein